MKFCTRDELTEHLGLIPGYVNNSYIDGVIEAASEAVNEYVQGNTQDDNSQQYQRITQATLLLAGQWYMDREGEEADKVSDDYGYGYLPPAVTALLFPLRKPVSL